MRYMLLCANAPDAWDTADAQPGDGVFDDWQSYTRALDEAGVLVEGAALQANETATSVRVRAGERLLSDGPFAEAKEHLIGYYVIEAPDLDVALDWAARVPNVRTGTVEVRPLMSGSTVAEMLARPEREEQSRV